jgi:hypothetical protein
MFSVLASTSPTAATAWANGVAGGGEGGGSGLRIGWVRTTENAAKLRATTANMGIMNLFIGFLLQITLSKAAALFRTYPSTESHVDQV